MTEILCRYPGDREQALVAYLYDDAGDAASRTGRLRGAPLDVRALQRGAGGVRGVRARSHAGRRPSFGSSAVLAWVIRLQPDPTGLRSRIARGFDRIARVPKPDPRVRSRTAGRERRGASSPRGRRPRRRCCCSAWRPGSRTSTSSTTPMAFASAPAGSRRVPATAVESRSTDDGPWRAELTALEQRLRADCARQRARDAANAGAHGPEHSVAFARSSTRARAGSSASWRCGWGRRCATSTPSARRISCGSIATSARAEQYRPRDAEAAQRLVNYVTVRTAPDHSNRSQGRMIVKRMVLVVIGPWP